MFWTIVVAVVVGIWIYNNLNIFENVFLIFIAFLAGCFNFVLKHFRFILAIISILFLFFTIKARNERIESIKRANYIRQLPTPTPTPVKKFPTFQPTTGQSAAEEFYAEIVRERGW